MTSVPHPPSAVPLGAAAPFRITTHAFQRIQHLVHNLFGIHLSPEKRLLVEGRLSDYLLSHGYPSFDAFVNALDEGRDLTLLSDLVNKLTTNHTYFYREPQHFDLLANVGFPLLLDLLSRRSDSSLRLWSAGCSKGDEPYTLAMLMTELCKPHPTLQWDILATDISASALAEAREATYPTDRIQALPPLWKVNHLRRIGEQKWRIASHITQRITFRRFNLMNATFPFHHEFHLILCRNVMIYFDEPTRNALIARFHKALAQGGLFICGHTEALPRKHCPFSPVATTVYQKDFV